MQGDTLLHPGPTSSCTLLCPKDAREAGKMLSRVLCTLRTDPALQDVLLQEAAVAQITEHHVPACPTASACRGVPKAPLGHGWDNVTPHCLQVSGRGKRLV